MSELSVLLIHGEFHGAWCWRDVVPALHSLGIAAHAIDLPGHGADPTPVREVSLEGYAREVMSNMSDRSLMVGHGMGGYPMSAAAEAKPDLVAGLVYVSAFVPQAQKSISDLRAVAQTDGLKGKTELADEGHSQTICPSAVEDLLYHDCPPGTLTYSAARINREPVAPMRTPLQSLDRAEGLPRFGVISEADKVISAEFQAQMYADISEENTERLGSSHAVFFSKPKELAETIARFSTTL